jgi:prepilin-type N-terminal cleavage/methylation domain-containing protein
MKSFPRPHSRASNGYTLIEMLIVLTIVGILLGVGVSGVQNLIRENRVAAVRQAAIQLQADLENIRSSAIRYNTDGSFDSVIGQTYSMTVPTGPNAITTRTRTLPSNLTIVITGATGTNAFPMVYRAPLSTISAIPREIRISTTGGIGIFVRVIGVTGRAVVTGVN